MNKTTRFVIVALVVAGVVGVRMLKHQIRKPVDPVREEVEPIQPSGATSKVRLLELGSVGCVPCKMMDPILDELKKDCSDWMLVDFIDVRQDEEASQKYGIKLIPTQIFFDASGKELFRHEGFFSKEDILEKWKGLGVIATEGSVPDN